MSDEEAPEELQHITPLETVTISRLQYIQLCRNSEEFQKIVEAEELAKYMEDDDGSS